MGRHPAYLLGKTRGVYPVPLPQWGGEGRLSACEHCSKNILRKALHTVNYWFSVKEHKTRLTSRRYIIQISEHRTVIHPSTSKDGPEVTLSQIRTLTVAR